MPSRSSQRTPGASGPKQNTKPPTKTARSRKSKEVLVDQTRRDHNVHENGDEQPVHEGDKWFSVAVNRWLDEPIAEGPYNGIASVGSWERQAVNDKNNGTAQREKKCK
ncbi:hypothetical protein VUR80DRAFT_6763 [Thermomyces stellatus]